MSDLMIFDQQPYERYTDDDQKVWSILFERQLKTVERYAYKTFHRQLIRTGLKPEMIPYLKRTNALLEKNGGWNLYPLPDLLTDELFFRLINFKRYGVNIRMRKIEKIDYENDTDMFTDLFGYAPLLTDPVISGFMISLSRIAEKYSHVEDAIRMINSVFAFTINFGIVKEGWQMKVFGGRLLSSGLGAEYALSSDAYRQPFHLDLVLASLENKTLIQDRYFVLESFGQLREILWDLDNVLSNCF